MVPGKETSYVFYCELYALPRRCGLDKCGKENYIKNIKKYWVN